MDVAVFAFLIAMLIPAVLVTLYIRRVIRVRQEAERERQRQLAARLRRQQAFVGNPKSVTRRTR